MLLPNLSHSTLYLVVIVVNYNILFTLIDVVVVVVVADFIIHRPSRCSLAHGKGAGL